MYIAKLITGYNSVFLVSKNEGSKITNMLLKSLVTSFCIFLCSSSVFCQLDDEVHRGLVLTFGYGVGYSNHAGSYKEQNINLDEFSGLRIIVVDARIGWKMLDWLEIYGTAKLSPSNSTISPYRSRYFGGAFAIHFSKIPNLSIHGGIGKYQSIIKKKDIEGRGSLANFGLAWNTGSNFLIDLSILTGPIKNDFRDDFPLNNNEFNISIGFAYRIEK